MLFFRLYCAGGQPIISKLYRQIEFPVSRGTPMIGSLVRWDHSQTFMVPKLEALCKYFGFKFVKFKLIIINNYDLL